MLRSSRHPRSLCRWYTAPPTTGTAQAEPSSRSPRSQSRGGRSPGISPV